MALLRIGDRYYAMGNYAKAADLYRMAMGKPGVDGAVANLHLGMALAEPGQGWRDRRSERCHRPSRRDRQILADLRQPESLTRRHWKKTGASACRRLFFARVRL